MSEAEKPQEKPKKKSAQGPFIVWSPDGETPPKVVHDTHGAAHFAAKQMAQSHPGVTFMVMQRSGRMFCHWPDEQVPAVEGLGVS
jgi:hypothetical protein